MCVCVCCVRAHARETEREREEKIIYIRVCRSRTIEAFRRLTFHRTRPPKVTLINSINCNVEKNDIIIVNIIFRNFR